MPGTPYAFENIKNNWGQIDGLVHCLAFAGRDELVGDYSATSSEGFDRALNISAYSLAPLCKAAKPLFSDGAGVVSLTYLGSERAIPNYNVMGVAKAALEASWEAPKGYDHHWTWRGPPSICPPMPLKSTIPRRMGL